MAEMERARDDRRAAPPQGGERVGGEWVGDESYWRERYASRPYARADRSFEYYRPAYRYGSERGAAHRGRRWDDAEPELRRGWERYEHRGPLRASWLEVRDAVRDAWDRVTRRGSDRSGRTSAG